VDELTLLDWKRRIFELYAEVRAEPDPERAWHRWREVRDDLFSTHPQTPLRTAAPAYFDYDPSFRVLAAAEACEHARIDIATSGDHPYSFTRFARAVFELAGGERSLDLYWLDGYGGGVYLCFADATSGTETYGAGRYLLDTVKGSDLGEEDGQLVLDFNFAYNPSCSYDPRWVCPLAPPGNQLAIPIRAGERIATAG
jgi:uncharacterized protein